MNPIISETTLKDLYGIMKAGLIIVSLYHSLVTWHSEREQQYLLTYQITVA